MKLYVYQRVYQVHNATEVAELFSFNKDEVEEFASKDIERYEAFHTFGKDWDVNDKMDFLSYSLVDPPILWRYFSVEI